MFLLSSLVAALLAGAGSCHEWIATFSNNGLSGTIGVNHGLITVDIDASGVNQTLFPDDCFASGPGLKYHVHQKWEWDDNMDRILDGCDGAATGGHIDPYAACGGATGNPYCDMCIDATGANYDCSPTTYEDNPLACEVGDWSGKYGLVYHNGDFIYQTSAQSFGEITDADVANMSIVFHCATNQRAFCAPFLESGMEHGMDPVQENRMTLLADFREAFTTSSKNAFVTLKYDGIWAYQFDAGTLSQFRSLYDCDDAEMEIIVYEKFMDTGDGAVSYQNCSDDIVGLPYDPTNMCFDEMTTSDFCEGMLLCNDTGYAYECMYDKDPFSCSPSDLSGRWGLVDFSENLLAVAQSDGTDRYMASLADLEGRGLALRCAETAEVMACAELINVGSAEAVATFSGEYGIEGSITVTDGYLTVDVDLSMVNESQLPVETCFDDGLLLHIHMLWTHTSDDDRAGTDCGAGFTGGHWDPYLACGPATGNADCDVKTLGGCVDPGYYFETGSYVCSAENFQINPYVCEIGDWSGKYGRYYVDNATGTIMRTDFSRFEVDAEDLDGLSVVFHCGNGDRAFCAPFEVYGEDTGLAPGFNTIEDTGRVETVEVTLPQGNGTMTFTGYGSEYDVKLAMSDGVCGGTGTVKYALFVDSACTEIYDPTISCLPMTELGTDVCTGDATCGSTAYSCDYETNPFSCAPSDLSGRYGEMPIPSGGMWETLGYDDTMIALESFDGRYVGLYCSTDSSIIFCVGPEVEYYPTPAPTGAPNAPNPASSPTDPPKGGSASGVSVLVPVAVTSLLFLVRGM